MCVAWCWFGSCGGCPGSWGFVGESVYHFRVSATNATGTSVGADGTFTTLRRNPLNSAAASRCPPKSRHEKRLPRRLPGVHVPFPQPKQHRQVRMGGGARKAPFTTHADGRSAVLETVGKTKITCKAGSGRASTADATPSRRSRLTLTGCEQSAKPCTSLRSGDGHDQNPDTGRDPRVAGAFDSKRSRCRSSRPAGAARSCSSRARRGRRHRRSTVLVPTPQTRCQQHDAPVQGDSGQAEPESLEGAPRETLRASIGGGPRTARRDDDVTQLSEERVEVNAVI